MKSLGIAIFFLLFLSINNRAVSLNLQVQDPRNTWVYTQGNIDSASMRIIPAGAYMRCELTLCFSGFHNGYSQFTTKDTLEVQYFFEMPTNISFVDSWLWIGNDKARANLIDRGRGTEIYEGIVKRRRDPSIFYKNTETNYEFRIFPLEGKSYRKAMIAWLIPIQFEQGKASIPLLNKMLSCSFTPPNLSVTVIKDTNIKNLRIERIAGATTVYDTVSSKNENYEIFNIKPTDIKYTNNLIFDNPMKNGVFLAVNEESKNEGYFQLAILPKTAFEFSKGKNIAFMIDYQADKSLKSPSEILNRVFEKIRNLTSKDSFNVFVSNYTIGKFSDNWTQATKENIDSAFKIINSHGLVYYSNLPLLMFTGLNWMEKQTNNGTAVIISSNDVLGKYSIANQIIQDVNAIQTKKFPLYFLDYCEINKQLYNNSNTYYYGNQYLYQNLAIKTGGELVNSNSSDFSDNLSKLIDMTIYQVKAFDMQFSFENGFTYARYTSEGKSIIDDLSKPLNISGRFIGEFPFKLNISGFFGNEGAFKSIIINEPNATDWQCKQIWNANYIKDLESKVQTNQVVNEIITVSIDNRVLSKNTVFLALETDIIKDPDIGNPTEVEIQFSSLKDEILIYPNPVYEFANINFNFENNSDIQEILIYDVLGSVVKTVSLSDFNTNSSFKWDLTSNNGLKIQAGTYMIVVKHNNKIYTAKLIVL